MRRRIGHALWCLAAALMLPAGAVARLADRIAGPVTPEVVRLHEGIQ